MCCSAPGRIEHSGGRALQAHHALLDLHHGSQSLRVAHQLLELLPLHLQSCDSDDHDDHATHTQLYRAVKLTICADCLACEAERNIRNETCYYI